MSCRCLVDCLPQCELWESYFFPPSHRGGSSSHEKKVLHCPGETPAIEPLPGRSELTWDGGEPGKSWGESELQGTMAMDKPGKYRVGQLFTWSLVSGTNQA